MFINTITKYSPQLLKTTDYFACRTLNLLNKAAPSSIDCAFINVITSVFDCFKNVNVQKLLLKVVLGIMMKVGPVPQWIPGISSLLHSDDISILILSGACMIIFISSTPESEIVSLFDVNYVRKALQIPENSEENDQKQMERKLKEIVLKLCGMVGKKREGAIILESSGLIYDIVNSESELGLEVLVTISKVLPCSSSLRDAVAIILKNEKLKNSKYLIPLLSYISINPEGAKLSVTALDHIIDILQTLEYSSPEQNTDKTDQINNTEKIEKIDNIVIQDNIDKEAILSLVLRILGCKEACKAIVDKDQVRKLAKVLYRLEGKEVLQRLKGLEKLAEIKEMKEIVKEVVDIPKITEEIKTLGINRAKRAALIRLLSRLNYVD